jgi:hypothetical protein
VDGLDHTAKGGKVIRAHFSRASAENDPIAPWCKIEPVMIDPSKVLKTATGKLSPIELLVIKSKVKP